MCPLLRVTSAPPCYACSYFFDKRDEPSNSLEARSSVSFQGRVHGWADDERRERGAKGSKGAAQQRVLSSGAGEDRWA